MFRRKRSAKDFEEEIQAHLELEADDLRGEGLSEGEARRRSRVEFGNVGAAEERFYMKDRWAALENAIRRVRFAWRSLAQSPGFTITAILTLALGVGANTAVFSVMNAVLLRSLPVEDPERVVYLRTSNTPSSVGTISSTETFSYVVFDALRREGKGLAPVMAFAPLSNDKVSVRYGAQPETAEGDTVSGGYFSGLGVKLPLGRGFTDEDERTHAPIVVLSHKYWVRRFASDPKVLGQTFHVNGAPMTIVGVAANGFEGTEAASSTEFWIPFQSRPELNAYGNAPENGKTFINNPKWWCLHLIGRIAPGMTHARAVAELQPVFQRAASEGLGTPKPEEKLPVLSFADAKSFPGYDEEYGKPLRMLMAMVVLVLVIAMANVVMLLLARNAHRRREFALRQALGAGRGDLFHQLVTESILLVTAGGALAWAFAVMATRLLANWAHIESTLAPDRSVMLFTLVVLTIALFVFALIPLRMVLASGAEQALKVSSATAQTDAGRSRTGKIIVTHQMSLCLVLLVGAGLLVRTLRNLESTPIGMQLDGLVVFGVKPDIKSVPQGVAFYVDLMNRLRALPGVQNVTVMEERIGTWWSNNFNMLVDGKLPEVANGAARTVRNNTVGPKFFTTLGVPILEGRDFADSDTASSPRVGIINEEFARRFLPNQNPLGHLIGPADLPSFQMTIVGVVKDHKYRSITETPIPMAWFNYAQIPMIGSMHVEMRVSGPPLAILPSVQKTVLEIDPNLPLLRPITQRAQYDLTISNEILFARLAGFFGLLAVVLVATGLYGTLAYRVSMRTAEIGVRMAIGARRGQVVWMILRDSFRLTAIGVGIGIPLAMLVGNALASSLYGVKPMDAASYLGAMVAVGVVALAASAIPAARAANVNPLRALRAE
ncbi:ABC efflux pump, inner membrane subunit [Candidatus Koribacter versatilis Ellin345]|uniref:ABC efflux pump, inner membrane subunit n=1 Tax=Koribacter versatilis (strain Ellin345) TaxID=204669 RepID=Q1IQZ1_KORVE|nr:ABC transporter permease [Candidatus Koribacter versatilis]ABF40709.1 ABC efflux pump, inner membrane subunit [Candidatus Koribacter versatilis Ellin345]